MEQEPIPFATAPEPDARPAAPPTAVTAWKVEPPERHRHFKGPAFVAAIVIFDLIVAAGMWFFLSPNASVVATGTVAPEILAQVGKDYPRFTVVGSKTLTMSETNQTVYSYTLRSIETPAFEMFVSYHAPTAKADGLEYYENDDDFFAIDATPEQPVGSFMRMWVNAHPGEECYFIYEEWDSSETTRTYQVSYDRYERNGIVTTSFGGTYRYAYNIAADSWTDITVPVEPDAAPGAVPATGSDALLADGSLADTGTAVAQALPGFEPAGVTTDARGDKLLIVRHRKRPGVRMALAPMWLTPPDKELDEIALFGGDRRRADAFAKKWASIHGGTVIDQLFIDLEDVGDINIVDVTYVESVAQVDDVRYEKSLVMKYDPKHHTWSVSK